MMHIVIRIFLQIHNNIINRMQKQLQAKQQKTVQLLQILKRGKLVNYPYYPISDTFHHRDFGISYLFTLQLAMQQSYLVIQPFKGQEILPVYNICLNGLPRKLMSYLYIMEFRIKIKQNGRLAIQFIDFIIGFSSGFLVRAHCDGRDLLIKQKFNKKPSVKQGLMMRMSSMFFTNQQWYQRYVEKPVLSFKFYPQNTLKYKYSYQVGNVLFFLTQLSEDIQSNTLKIFTQLEWTQIKSNCLNKYPQFKAVVIKQRNLKAIITSFMLIIEFDEQVPPSYIYNNSGLYVANNIQNKIILYNVETLRRMMVYRVDWQIKRMKIQNIGHNRQILMVMPYDNYLYVIDLTANTATCLKGHRSFITNCVITDKGMLITAGCDHRIGLKLIANIQHWQNIPQFYLSPEQISKMSQKRKQLEIEAQYTKYFQISADSLVQEKFGESYFFGQFDNIYRNNNFQYGFGNFLELNKSVYAFLTYDFQVKIYRILG